MEKNDIQTNQKSTFITNAKYENDKQVVDLTTQSIILQTTEDNPLAKTNLEPGQSVETTVTLRKVLSTENDSDDFGNIAEIVEIANDEGRYDRGATPGNQNLENSEIEHDSVRRIDDMIMPPTGSVHIYYGLGILITVILAGGLYLIKKYVLEAKNK